jgi:hypothetical protein
MLYKKRSRSFIVGANGHGVCSVLYTIVFFGLELNKQSWAARYELGKNCCAELTCLFCSDCSGVRQALYQRGQMCETERVQLPPGIRRHVL